MKVFSAMLALASFTGTLALLLSMLDLMSFFEQAFILWVCLPVGMGSILAYFMNKTATRKHKASQGYMSQEWTITNF
jgi:hypothetical protein